MGQQDEPQTVEFHLMYDDGGSPKSGNAFKVQTASLPPVGTELLIPAAELEGVHRICDRGQTWVVTRSHYHLQELPGGNYKLHPHLELWPWGETPPGDR